MSGASTVHLYAVCWNEAEVLGFFLRHYEPWVDRFVVFDDGSDDGSTAILASHPKVDLRPFERVAPDSFELSMTAMLNNAWKQSRGVADWVVLTDVDEHLLLVDQPVDTYLAEQARHGVTLIPALGFDLNSAELPEDRGRLVDVVRRGRPRTPYNKLAIFDPDAVVESGVHHGRHLATPTGEIRLPARDELMLWHYKHLGFERWDQHEAAQGRRRGPRDLQEGWGGHMLRSSEERRAFWQAMEEESRELGGAGFDPAAVAARPLWWEDLPRVRAS